jgi:hypothetical protein
MKQDISQEQINFLVKQVLLLPEDKIEFKTYDDDPDIIKVIGRHPGGTVSFRMYNSESKLQIEITPKNGYTTTRTIQLASGFILFNKNWRNWWAVKGKAVKIQKKKLKATVNVAVEDVSKVIDQVFPEALEKTLLGE